MSSATFFVQRCPICGRRLRIRVEYLGRTLVCQHCGARFVAADPVGSSDQPSTQPVLQRANQLLESAPHVLRKPRIAHPR